MSLVKCKGGGFQVHLFSDSKLDYDEQFNGTCFLLVIIFLYLVTMKCCFWTDLYHKQVLQFVKDNKVNQEEEYIVTKCNIGDYFDFSYKEKEIRINLILKCFLDSMFKTERVFAKTKKSFPELY